MIEIKLQGRLGNQMFQYAYAQSLANRLGAELKLDLSNYRHFSEARNFELWRFEQLGLTPVSTTHVLTRRLSNLVQRRSAQEFRMEGLGFDPAALEVQDDTRICGWFQSLRYFEAQSALFRQLYNLEPFLPVAVLSAARSRAGNRPLLALHVRRGDYVGNREFFLGDYDAYYARALAHLGGVIGDDLHLLVVSDDPDWCATWPFLKGRSHEIYRPAPGDCALSDMALMAACDHNVISNSTFSWWAAWLADPADRQVVMPQQWLPKWTAQDCGLDVPYWTQL